MSAAMFGPPPLPPAPPNPGPIPEPPRPRFATGVASYDTLRCTWCRSAPAFLFENSDAWCSTGCRDADRSSLSWGGRTDAAVELEEAALRVFGGAS